MKKESFKLSKWIGKKLNEMEERTSLFKTNPIDIINGLFLAFVLFGIATTNSFEIPVTLLIALITLLVIQTSVSQKIIMKQEKRIRELEKSAQNQSSDPT